MTSVLDPIIARVHRGYCWRVKPGEHPQRIDFPLDDERITQHLRGPNRFGVTPIAPGESTTRLALLDFDSHKGEVSWSTMVETAGAVMQAARDSGMEALPFRSSGGSGIHLYFLFDDFQDAFSVREALKVVLAQCNLSVGVKGVAAGEVEVFPKQSEVAADAFGSMFVLPMGGGSKSCALKGLE